MKHVSKHSPCSLKCIGVFDSEECMLAKGSTYHKSTVYLNVYVTVHGKRAHLTRTFFSRGCSETALQNDAICSDVTRSTRTLYAQIAVERESSYSRTSGQNSNTVIPRACA